MKKLFFLFAILLSVFSYFLSPTIIYAEDERFAPFSAEGNPPDDYYFDEIFPLFRYIRPSFLKVFENMERSRNYENLQRCTFAGADRRDDYCDNDNTSESACDGGDIDICHKGDGADASDPSSVAYAAHSGSGTCRYSKSKAFWADGEIVTGTCEYKKLPSLSQDIKGTDFSAVNSSSNATSSLPASSASPNPNLATTGVSSLVFPKYQNENSKYSNQGSDNSITWGSHYLSLGQCDLTVKKLIVVKRAKQTKATLNETGEWPLGWVDWGYKDGNMSKTLIEIHDELPDNVSAEALNIVNAVDTFFLSAGLTSADYSDARKEVCETYDKAISKKTPDQWALDLNTAPLYSPSFRQGYARGSICVWDLCCPGPRCPLPGALGEFEGKSKALYYDISVSQAFGAAIDDLLMSYTLDEGVKEFNRLAIANPLIRYATTASVKAIPSRIHQKLTSELSDKCLQYLPGPGDFTLGWFGFHMDYLKSPSFFGPNNTCPDYVLQPDLTKERGAAFPQSFLSRLVALFWRGGANGPGGYVDSVEPQKLHYITIPDAMGQTLSEIEDPVYQTRDTLAELAIQNKYNLTLSNIADGEGNTFYAGKGIPVGDAKRRLAYFACNDDMYSAPESTSVEAYALGTRIGCVKESDVIGKCDPTKFGQIIADSNWKLPTSQAQDIVKNSAMFIGGKLNPVLEDVYSKVSEETGVPCEILAAHHFEEATQFFTGGGDPTKHSVANGQDLKDIGQTLLESAQSAAKSITSKPYYNKNTAGLIQAMSNFNGGGNSNCQLGFPALIPYGGCPRQFIGEDDPYATNLLDARHTNMFLLYCGDFTPCLPPRPYGNDRPGAFGVALVIHDYLTSQGSQ